CQLPVSFPTRRSSDLTHPSLVNGKRSTLYPSLSLPLITPGSFLTPKVGVHYTYYSLYDIPTIQVTPTSTAFPVLPIGATSNVPRSEDHTSELQSRSDL